MALGNQIKMIYFDVTENISDFSNILILYVLNPNESNVSGC